MSLTEWIGDNFYTIIGLVVFSIYVYIIILSILTINQLNTISHSCNTLIVNGTTYYNRWCTK